MSLDTGRRGRRAGENVRLGNHLNQDDTSSQTLMRSDLALHILYNLLLQILILGMSGLGDDCAQPALSARSRSRSRKKWREKRTICARQLSRLGFGPNADDGAVCYERAGEEDALELGGGDLEACFRSEASVSMARR